MTASRAAGARLARAMKDAGSTQHALSRKTGISPATLSRIIEGARAPKMNEVISIAGALGSSLSELTGHSAVRDRVECGARPSDDASTETMRRELIHYLELDAYLEDQGIAHPS